MNAPEDNAVEFDSKSNSEYQNCSKDQQCPPKWDSKDNERLLSALFLGCRAMRVNRSNGDLTAS